MIPLKDQELIRAKFAAELIGPVKIDVFTERELGITVPGKTPCQYCKPTQEMMQEVSGLHPMISLRVHFMEDKPSEAETYGIERVPAIVLRGVDGIPREPGASARPYVKFYGIPAGTEFPSFLETISDVSRQEVLLSQESLGKLMEIKNEVGVKVFTTPTCPYCPAVARIVCQIGMVNPMVRPEVIEVAEFPELAERYNVKAVPLTVIGERKSIPGMVPEETLVEEIAKAAAALAAEGEAAGKRIERGRERPSGLIIP
jgi:glutaredoxin-like protein